MNFRKLPQRGMHKIKWMSPHMRAHTFLRVAVTKLNSPCFESTFEEESQISINILIEHLNLTEY